MERIGFVIAVLLSLSASSSALRAGNDLLADVATCTGRISALLDLQRASGHPKAQQTAVLHAHMTDLMSALITPESDRQARAVRAQTKRGFKILLARVPSGDDAPRAARMASLQAQANLRTCAALILTRDETEKWLEDGAHVVAGRQSQQDAPWRHSVIVGK